MAEKSAVVLERLTRLDLDQIAPAPGVEKQAQIARAKGVAHPRSAWTNGMIIERITITETKMTMMRVARSRLRNMGSG